MGPLKQHRRYDQNRFWQLRALFSLEDFRSCWHYPTDQSTILMKNLRALFFLGLGSLLIFSCQKESLNPDSDLSIQPKALKLAADIEPLDGRTPMSPSGLRQHAIRSIDEQGIYHWSEASDYLVWSAALASDSIISIGYQPEGYTGIEHSIHQVNVQDPAWIAVREGLINYVLERNRILDPSRDWQRSDVIAFGEKPLPYLNLRVWDYETLAHLRNFTVTRYCEPMGFGIEEGQGPLRSDSGCGSNGPSANVPASHYTIAPQGALISWNFLPMNIHKAWLSGARGQNVTLGLIDTGTSPGQAKLNSQFSGGFSGNRSIEKLGFHVTCSWFFFCANDGVNDLCGHGTNMAGTLAGPFSADGAPAGVAFRSNLVAVRASEDVVVNGSSEKDGVSDAFVYLGNRSDLRIISMSLGDLFSSGQVTDAINFAHNQGKMIFCAAGTSLTWTTFVGVIFPANLSNTIAVTGIKTGSLNNMQKCSTCHSGSEVDFVVTMEDQNNSSKQPLTLADAGNAPTYTGGSSVATATAAGIAALVLGTNTGQTNAQVIDRMKQASNFYPNRNGAFGWGRINAELATQ
jgi:hypothetical protein